MPQQNDEQVAKFCSSEPNMSKSAAVQYIENIPTTCLWRRAICLADHAIGSVSVFSFPGNNEARAKSAQIGYVLGSNYWGKGIATKAVKMVVEMVFVEFPDLERLEALVDVENVVSQRVLEKAGFQREGILRKYLLIKGKSRDMVMFSLISEEV